MIAPGNINLQDVIRIRCNRRKVGSPTLNSQPGAHTGATRKYIPDYADANIVYLDQDNGNDSNSGATELLPKLTQAAAETAAGSTKKIRVINDNAILGAVSKPTEMKRGLIGTISGNFSTSADSWSIAGTPSFGASDIHDVQHSEILSKFVAVGESGKIATSTDGDTWAQAATPSFGSSTIYSVAESSSILVAVGESGKIATSTDGDTWVQRTSGTTASLYKVHYNKYLRKFAALGTGSIVLLSDDGIAWSSAEFRSSNMQNTTGNSQALSSDPRSGIFVLGDGVGRLSYSQDGNTWKDVGNTPSNAIVSIVYNSLQKELLALCNGANGWRSTDGVTWIATSTDRGGNEITYVPDFGLYLVVSQFSNVISWGSNGNSWTTATTPNITSAYGVAVSSSKLCVVVGDAGVIVYKQISQPAISANIAGFTVYGATFSGSPKAYNCTLRKPVTTAALSLDSCRITESGAHISNNAQTHFGNLIEGDFNVTGVPASQNAISLNCNTITGKLSIFNSSSTTYEQIRDNIIEGGFYANYATIMLSGNLRGTNTNGVLSQSVSYDDPVFVDTTDYKLKRKSQGDSQDSPLVAAAAYYLNEQGELRDVGAWSLDDSALPLEYGHTFFIRKPAGQGLKPKKVPAASADQGIDGVWDGTNEPARASEHLTFTCTSVPREDLVAQDFIESLDDLTCEVTLDPAEAAPKTPIVVNGNHSAGVPVLNIDASTTIKSGMVLTISGVAYLILYTIGGTSVTQLVLHNPLESSVSDNASITPNDPVGDGDYIFMPQQRETPRPQAQEKDVVLNLTWAFVRQYPQL